MMGYPPADSTPLLIVTGRSVAGAFSVPFCIAGSSTSAPAEAVIDLDISSAAFITLDCTTFVS
jgi:hypothetical protein